MYSSRFVRRKCNVQLYQCDFSARKCALAKIGFDRAENEPSKVWPAWLPEDTGILGYEAFPLHKQHCMRWMHPQQKAWPHCSSTPGLKHTWAANFILRSIHSGMRILTKLDRARSRLYRSQILQANMRLKALVEIYTMHSFA